MARAKNRKAKITKGERLLYFCGVFCLALTFVLKVFCGTSISNMKMDIEKTNHMISDQENKNQSLVMQVNELTSYENVKDVLKDMGLAYNNENIVVINK